MCYNKPMKKLRFIVRAAIVALAVISIVGLVLLVNRDLDAGSATYEIIVFVFAIVCVVTAILSQVESYRSEKTLRKMIKDLQEIDAEVDEESKQERSLRKKVDEILALDRKIYNKLGKKAKQK